MKHARQDYNRIQDPTGKIPANEPVFLLRGQDICATFAIQAWAEEAEKRGADPEIIRKARTWAAEMITYQANVKSKLPDCPKYEVPGIVAGLSFKSNDKGGFFTVLEVYDTAPTCLVQAYHKEGDTAWRDIWKVEEVKKHFEKGHYWEVKIGEMGDGRRVVLMDPGAIQTPYEALMGEPPKSWRPGTSAMPVINDLGDINLQTTEGRLLMAALAKLTTESQRNKTPWEVIGQLNELKVKMYDENGTAQAAWDASVAKAAVTLQQEEERKADQDSANTEVLECVRCGNWYGKNQVCAVCFIESNGPDQPQ